MGCKKNEHSGPTRVSTLSYHLLSFTGTKVSSRNSLQKEVSVASYLTKLIIDRLLGSSENYFKTSTKTDRTTPPILNFANKDGNFSILSI